MKGISTISALCVVGSCSSSAIAETPSSATANRARLLLAEGKPDSAAVLLSGALMTDSSNSVLLLTLADVQKANKQSTARRATLEKVLSIQNRSVEARLALAEDFFTQKQPDSAAFFAGEAVLNSNGRSGEAYYWLGRIHHQAGRPDSAVYYYRVAWNLSPSGKLF